MQKEESVQVTNLPPLPTVITDKGVPKAPVGKRKTSQDLERISKEKKQKTMIPQGRSPENLNSFLLLNSTPIHRNKCRTCYLNKEDCERNDLPKIMNYINKQENGWCILSLNTADFIRQKEWKKAKHQCPQMGQTTKKGIIIVFPELEKRKTWSIVSIIKNNESGSICNVMEEGNTGRIYKNIRTILARCPLWDLRENDTRFKRQELATLTDMSATNKICFWLLILAEVPGKGTFQRPGSHTLRNAEKIVERKVKGIWKQNLT